MSGAFPREIVISPGYGSGLVTSWIHSRRYDVIEHPRVIQACREGLSWDVTLEVLAECGFTESEIIDMGYGGGWDTAEVRTVHGPYIVDEYDGSEFVLERDAMRWRS